MTELIDSISALTGQIGAALLKPAQFLGDPSKRVFWLYLAVSLLIAVVVMVSRHGTRWFPQLYLKLLSPKIWWHKSARLDLKLIFVKVLCRVFLFSSWIASSYGIALGLVVLCNEHFGAINLVGLTNTQITLLYTGVLFLSADFSRYVVHRLCHEVPFLWEFHQVHHSAEVMTPLTLYRSHPVENLLSVLRGVIVTGVVTGLFFYLFGTRAVQAQVLGVNILGLLFNMLGANLRHSHVWISYGSFFERILISPAQHQIHHSDHPKHRGANYGSCLAVWDWFGGSLHLAEKQANVTFGLSPETLNHDPHVLGSAILGPFKGCWRMLSSWGRTHRSSGQIEYD